MKLLVTGGAGFIGSAVVRHALQNRQYEVVNIDSLTYAANLDNLTEVENNPGYVFEEADIRDAEAMQRIFEQHRPDAVMHLAAESHVDRSIDGPLQFVDTNVMGTATLLDTARRYWSTLDKDAQAKFRFHHVSTDEVYGSLGDTGLFTEESRYQPNSPYAASKAGSDMLVRSWGQTYGMPVVITNCSNNYGPFQFPEKLIPVVILKAVAGEPIPVYGAGTNVRDWLYVEDHAEALLTVLERGRLNELYNIGGNNELQNIELVKQICTILDEVKPKSDGTYADQITFVGDRPGHDLRYAIDASKMKDELGWEPAVDVEAGVRKTVEWYLANSEWWQAIQNRGYKQERLGQMETAK